ncbi:nicotinate (nicotinamide) nucleotide adenylyltransferase [Henriciella algicola]|uniref:nicotinate (nicotinamide) nucleotide adenylyltransferase n=1 Tax=Henriciella algicola TaxID=1608422 RepID=UPI001F02BBC1|nr:nicotinate (nicotinamide) nucleotide adenylyltransferase [Henriciella algicola]
MTSHFLSPVRTLPPAKTTQRIGLFGGSFDPPHSGHLHVAKTAMKRLGLDWIYWLPASGNPLKSKPADFYDRLHAVRELAGGHPKMFVSDFEHWAGLRYTADVVRAFTAHSRNARFVWLMGADSLRNFHDWKNWESVAATLPLCIVSRPDAGPRALSSPFARRFAKFRLAERDAASLAFTAPPAWVYLKAPFDATSSTQLRAHAQKG